MRRLVLIAYLPGLLLCSCATFKNGQSQRSESMELHKRFKGGGGVSWGEDNANQDGFVEYGYSASVKSRRCDRKKEWSAGFFIEAGTKPQDAAIEMADAWNRQVSEQELPNCRAFPIDQVVFFPRTCPDERASITFVETGERNMLFENCNWVDELKNGADRPAGMTIKRYVLP